MDFVAIDFETANHLRSSACSIGIAVVKNNEIVETRSFFIKPTPNYYAPMNVRIHGISGKHTDSAKSFLELWGSELQKYFIGRDIVAHNAPFEKSVLNALAEVYGINIPTDRIYCSLKMARQRLDLLNYQLDSVCSALGVLFNHHHDAKADAIGCAEIVLKLAQKFKADSLDDIYLNAPKKSQYASNDTLFSECYQATDYSVDEDVVKDKAFCFTGKLSFIQRDIAKIVIEKAGGVFKSGLSSKVDYLVVGDLSLFGDNYQSEKLKKLKLYREKGSKIEIITEQQFQEIVVYEGPKITKEIVESNSKEFLQANYANALYGKGICLSEGFDADFMCRLALLGISMAPTHYEEDAYLTDYYIMSNSVLKDLFVDGIKSPSVIRMESAMRKQLEPDEDETSYHRLKCIDEDTIREFLSRRKRYEQEVQDGVESKSMGLR